uniref:Uncharacterized protein n=1 Tax=Glossina pallidipes TaxID=7398 RepID=A0A1B0A8B2_GLOPL
MNDSEENQRDATVDGPNNTQSSNHLPNIWIGKENIIEGLFGSFGESLTFKHHGEVIGGNRQCKFMHLDEFAVYVQRQIKELKRMSDEEGKPALQSSTEKHFSKGKYGKTTLHDIRKVISNKGRSSERQISDGAVATNEFYRAGAYNLIPFAERRTLFHVENLSSLDERDVDAIVEDFAEQLVHPSHWQQQPQPLLPPPQSY